MATNRPHVCYRFLVPLLLILAAGPGRASGHSAQLPEIESGVVLNRTVTVGGQEFFQHFDHAWRDHGISERLIVSVHELPNPRFGSRIWVESGQRRLFEAVLPTGRSSIRPLAERAAEAASERAAEAEVERLLFRHADLGRDEI